MPEFLEDPSVLTKEKLKSELVANNVTLPAGEQTKNCPRASSPIPDAH